MAIAAIRTHGVSAPLHTPFVTALRRTTTVDTLVVEITDTDGRSGFGEAPQVWQVTGASIAGSRACVHEVLSPPLIGADPDDLLARCTEVSRAVAGNEAAKAATDVALHDLAARRIEVPLARLLGGSTKRIPTDVTLAADDTQGVATAARQRIADGFDVLKLKVGTDPGGDLARVRAVRSAIGPRPRIRLDANQGWTPRQAVRIINQITDTGLDVELIEQPIPRWDIDGLAWVSDRVEVPILADEAVYGIRDLIALIYRRAADMVNIKLAKCGGLRTARTLLDLATAHEIGTIVGSMMETHIGIGAAASLAAAHGTSTTPDLDAAWWLAHSPINGGIHYDQDTVVLPNAPGLGITGIA